MPFLHDDLFVDMFTGPFSQSPWRRGSRDRGWGKKLHSCKKHVDNRQSTAFQTDFEDGRRQIVCFACSTTTTTATRVTTTTTTLSTPHTTTDSTLVARQDQARPNYKSAHSKASSSSCFSLYCCPVRCSLSSQRAVRSFF